MSDALIIPVDSSQVEKGKRSLADLAAQGKKTEHAIGGFTKATVDQKQALSELLGKIDPTVAAFGRLDILQKELIRNKKKGFIDTDTFDVYSKKLQTTRAELGKYSELSNGATKSTKELAFALRGVPAQFTDIATSLQGGQKPLTVLLQQGGQLKDMFGGVGAAARALGGYVIGLINPYTLAAGAIAAITAAYAGGANESTRLNTALINTGKIAGSTAGNITELATQLGEATGKYSLAREAAQALADSGLIVGRDIPTALRGVIDSVELTGKSVKDVVKDFEKLTTDPLKGLVDLNKTQNFLTLDIYKQIAALEKQGRTQEAATLAIKTYADVLASRKGEVVANLGAFEQMWRAIARAADSAKDSFFSIGRELTNTEKLKKLGKEYADLLNPKNYTSNASSGTKSEIANKLAELTKLSALVSGENAKAIAIANKNRLNTQKIQGLEFLNDAKLNLANLSEKDARTAGIEKINQEFASHLKALGEGTKEFNELIKLRDQAIVNSNNKSNASSIKKEESSALKALNEQRKYALELIQEEINQELILANEAGADYLKIIEETKKALESQVSVNQQHIASIYDAIVASEAEVENFGKLPSEIERTTIARLEEIKAVALANGGSLESVKNIQLEIDARKKLGESFASKEILEANKKANDERVKQAQQAADDTAKAYEKMSDDINKSLTDALLRGFESGKGFAKNFRDTLVNMFKTLILRPTIEAILKPLSDGVSGILSKGLTGGASGGTSGGGSSSILGQIKDVFSTGNNAIVSSISNLGQSLSAFGSGGTGILRDIASSVGSFTSLNAGLISKAAPYAGAVLQLAQGNIAGAAFTAIGTAIGGPIGGAIGGFVGSFFGGKKKIPRFSTQRAGQYDDGVFTGSSAGQKYKPLGAESQIDSLSEQFSKSLGGFLTGFGLDDKISSTSSLFKKRKASYGNFSASFDGGTVTGGTTGKAKNVQDTFARLIETVLGSTLAEAITKSKVVAGIKDLFAGLTDKAVVASLILATTSLNAQEVQLNRQFGLTVDIAGKVVKASGAAGQGLADFASKLAAIAQSTQTVGDVLVKSRADLVKGLGVDLPKSLADYDALIKSINTSTLGGQKQVADLFKLRDAFDAYGQAIDGLKSGVAGATFNLRDEATQKALKQAEFDSVFTKLGIAAPKSKAELLGLADTLDYTSKAGLDLAAIFPALRNLFDETANGVNDLSKSLENLRDESGFKTLYDFNFYKGIASNYGAEFANRLNDGAPVSYGASNNTSANLPLNIAPNNNTAISTSDPNMLNAITLLTNTVNTLKAEIISIKTNTKSSADTLLRVSPNGNSIQTKVAA